MRLLKRKPQSFEIQVQDMVLRITASPDLSEESRAAALQFWEQLHAYVARHPEFRSSKRPLHVPPDAPAIVREMAAVAVSAGVGPVFSLQGAVTDSVGRFLVRSAPEVTVANGGDYFIVTRKRMKLTVLHEPGGEPISVVVDPRHRPTGVSTTLGRTQLPSRSVDGLVVLASSCMLADAAAAAVQAICTKPEQFRRALTYLQDIPGVVGGVVVQGDRIGVAGSVELAA